MFVRHALDKTFMLERAQAINRRLVGDDIAAKLDLANQGGTAMFADIQLDELEHGTLFLGERQLSQVGPRGENLP